MVTVNTCTPSNSLYFCFSLETWGYLWVKPSLYLVLRKGNQFSILLTKSLPRLAFFADNRFSFCYKLARHWRHIVYSSAIRQRFLPGFKFQHWYNRDIAFSDTKSAAESEDDDIVCLDWKLSTFKNQHWKIATFKNQHWKYSTFKKRTRALKRCLQKNEHWKDFYKQINTEKISTNKWTLKLFLRKKRV